jgi:hypothetical protein
MRTFFVWLRLLCEAVLGSVLVLASVRGVIKGLLSLRNGTHFAYQLGEWTGTGLLTLSGVFLLRDSINVATRPKLTAPVIDQ